jgi:predicted alpha/beta hydrolase family esterase
MKNVKVFLIHGFEGKPNGGWRPWLMGELEKKNIFCQSLAMPNPSKPILKDWLNEIKITLKKYPKDKIILVGHSLGVPAVLSYLQNTNSKQIKGCVLVSGPYRNDKKILKNFFEKEFDFATIKKVCKNFSIIHGDNDKAVPFEHATFLKENLNGNLVKVKNGGHLNGSAGFLKLPQALNEIVKITSKK